MTQAARERAEVTEFLETNTSLRDIRSKAYSSFVDYCHDPGYLERKGYIPTRQDIRAWVKGEEHYYRNEAVKAWAEAHGASTLLDREGIPPTIREKLVRLVI